GLWVLLGALVLDATPGQWMMRLHLRTPADASPGAPRLLVRFALQHAYLLAGVLGISALYAAQDAVAYSLLGVGAALAAVSLLGSALALFTARRQTLHDLLSGTMVVIDVR